jgi:hypothetical protein
MANTLTKAFTVISLLIFIFSCDRQVCKNTNPIFDKYSPSQKEYKDELIEELSKVEKSKLTYWMDTYQEENQSKYIHAFIQGDGLCAKIILTLNGENKGIEELIKNKGMGYRGAELENLIFEIKQDSTTTEFIFREIGGIID